MWGTPMFDLHDAAGVMLEVNACRKEHPQEYIKVLSLRQQRTGWETVRMSFIIHRPSHEPGFDLVRQEGPGRNVRYTLRSYATGRPSGERYAP